MKRRIYLSVLFLLILNFVVFATSVGDPIGHYLDKAEQTALNIIDNAGAQGKGIVMEAAQGLLNAINAFRAAYKDCLTKTEEMLIGQQHVLFQNIKGTVGQIERAIGQSTEKIQTIVDTLSNSITNIPLSKNIPRVSKAFPLVDIKENEKMTILNIRGIGLANADPCLKINDTTITPTVETDNLLRFEISQKFSTQKGTVSFLDCDLTLYQIKRKAIFFKSESPHHYRIKIVLVPKQYGKIKVTPKLLVNSIVREKRKTGHYRHPSPRGRGCTSVPVSISAREGWQIDTSTIAFIQSYNNHGSQTLNSQSPSGFTATLTACGWGRVEVRGIPLDQGSVGVISGNYEYFEYKNTTELKNGEESEYPTFWGKAITINDLPGNTENVIVQLITFNGETHVVEGTGDNRFVEVSFNPNSKVLTITPKSVEFVLK